jgi:hypothetical protein
MSTRAQQTQLIRDSGFLDQLAGSLLYTANQVVNEASTTANHINRIAYANSIFLSPQSAASFMAPGILTNATISAEAGTPSSISDSDMDYVVASLFDKYANQYAASHNIGAGTLFGS